MDSSSTVNSTNNGALMPTLVGWINCRYLVVGWMAVGRAGQLDG